MRKPEIKLVKGWKYWWRQWSTWLVTIGTSCLYFTPELAESLTYVWAHIPMDIKSSFHEEWVRCAGYILLFVSIPAKLVTQRKLEERRERDNREEARKLRERFSRPFNEQQDI